jgi:methylmalonyl-CoA/ethylmalonyl-CoA epimerase
MPETIDVERMGHINHVAADYDQAIGFYRRVFDVDVFREWSEGEFGTRNALWLLGPAAFELFGVADDQLALGQWVAKQGQGWHSVEWTVPDLDTAAEAATARNIRVITVPGRDLVFTHPRDLHGLCLELTATRWDADSREHPGWEPRYWRDEHPLRICGGPLVSVASDYPERAAADVARLTGREVRRVDLQAVNGVSYVIDFPDHSLAFAGSRTGVTSDMIGRFVAERGPRVFSLTLFTSDFQGARAYLTGLGVPFRQFGRGSLFMSQEAASGALIEIRQAEG